jgi:hypothetical protein
MRDDKCAVPVVRALGERALQAKFTVERIGGVERGEVLLLQPRQALGNVERFGFG